MNWVVLFILIVMATAWHQLPSVIRIPKKYETFIELLQGIVIITLSLLVGFEIGLFLL